MATVNAYNVRNYRDNSNVLFVYNRDGSVSQYQLKNISYDVIVKEPNNDDIIESRFDILDL